MMTVLVMLGYLAIGYLLIALQAYFGEIDRAYDFDNVGVSTELLEELVTGLLFWPVKLFSYLSNVLFSDLTLLFICKPLITASQLGATRRDKLGRDSR
jgi:hypothetical protein